MKKVRWLPAAAGTAILAFSLAMPTAAYAADSPSGDTAGVGNLSILNGNGINVPVSVPVSICGVAVGVLGGSDAGCQGGASASTAIVDPSGGGPSGGLAGSSGGSGNTTGVGNVTAGDGNTVNAPISAPVSLCSVSGAVAGAATSHCQGGSRTSTTIVDPAGDPAGSGGRGNTTGVGNVSAGDGNTVNAPVSAPVSVCSISLAILGFADSGCAGGASTDSTIISGTGGDSGNTTGVGNLSLLDGNTINAPISAPISICSISLAILGEADSGCRGGATTTTAIISPSPTCHDRDCAPPACHGRDCVPPVCHGRHCAPPVCHGRHCAPPVCHGRHCVPPACHGRHCTPPPGCVGSSCTVVPPGTSPGGGGTHHRHPGGGISGFTTSGGSNSSGGNSSNSGSPNVTSATTTSMTGNLPTTGADLAMVAAAAFGSIAAGTGAVMFARRRRSNRARQAEVSQAA